MRRINFFNNLRPNSKSRGGSGSAIIPSGLLVARGDTLHKAKQPEVHWLRAELAGHNGTAATRGQEATASQAKRL